MNFPSNLLYTADHEWVKIEGNIAWIGVTDFAQSELGDIVYIDIPTVGKTVEKHSVFGTIEAVKTVSDLFAPMEGEIIELNPILESNPEKVNSDPYGEGWMVKMKVNNPDISELLSPEAYQASLNL